RVPVAHALRRGNPVVHNGTGWRDRHRIGTNHTDLVIRVRSEPDSRVHADAGSGSPEPTAVWKGHASHGEDDRYDAQPDKVPVVAVTGMTYHDVIGAHLLHDLNPDDLFRDACVF